MKTKWQKGQLGGVVLVVFLALVVWGGLLRPAGAGQAENAQQLVDRSRLTLNAFVADQQMGPPLKALLQRARGVLIYPRVLRGAFIVGASGGSGTLVAYDVQTKKWAGPAFYTIGGASFGLQALPSDVYVRNSWIELALFEQHPVQSPRDFQVQPGDWQHRRLVEAIRADGETLHVMAPIGVPVIASTAACNNTSRSSFRLSFFSPGLIDLISDSMCSGSLALCSISSTVAVTAPQPS